MEQNDEAVAKAAKQLLNKYLIKVIREGSAFEKSVVCLGMAVVEMLESILKTVAPPRVSLPSCEQQQEEEEEEESALPLTLDEVERLTKELEKEAHEAREK